MGRPRKVLWLSDIHMTEPGRSLRGRDPGTYLGACVDHVRRHHPGLDACVVSGDLAETASDAEYARVKALLAPLACPVAATMGNHDGRDAFWRVFGAGGQGAGFVNAVLDVGPEWRILLLDSMADRHQVGALGPERLAWLEARLGEAKGRRVALFLHHPPFNLGIPSFDNSSLPEDDRQAFAGLVAGCRDRVQLIGFGHCHRISSSTLRGVPAVGIGSVLFQARANFADAGFSDDPARPGSYGIILLDGGDAVVHPVDFPVLPQA